MFFFLVKRQRFSSLSILLPFFFLFPMNTWGFFSYLFFFLLLMIWYVFFHVCSFFYLLFSSLEMVTFSLGRIGYRKRNAGHSILSCVFLVFKSYHVHLRLSWGHTAMLPPPPQADHCTHFTPARFQFSPRQSAESGYRVPVNWVHPLAWSGGGAKALHPGARFRRSLVQNLSTV